MKNYKINLFVLLLLFLSCKIDKEKQGIKNEDIGIIIDENKVIKKNVFSDLLNEYKKNNIVEQSINNLDTLNGFRSLKLGTHLDSLSKMVDMSNFYTKTYFKLKDLEIKSNYIYFNYSNSPDNHYYNAVLTEVDLFFYKEKLIKINLNYQCPKINGCLALGIMMVEDLEIILGKSNEIVKSDCETLSHEDAIRRARFFNIEVDYEVNCDNTYIWESDKISLVVKEIRSSYPIEMYGSTFSISLKSSNDLLKNDLKLYNRIIERELKTIAINEDSIRKNVMFREQNKAKIQAEKIEDSIRKKEEFLRRKNTF